jgi:glycosyltransferase involved in cell wall biosynthesis
VLPMKVFNYLGAGRPILAPDLPDTKGVLEHGRNCLKVAPDDRRAAAAGLALLGSDAVLCERLGAAAATAARRFTWEARARRIVAIVEQGLARARRGEGRA